jgi:hypothetical protein
MAEIIQFPGVFRPDMMPGHAIDLLWVRQVISSLIDTYGTDTKEMWDEFGRLMRANISGFFAFKAVETMGGKEVSIICVLPLGKFQSSVYVLNRDLCKS